MSRKAKHRVEARKHADANHDVVTMISPPGSSGCRKIPCAECPWRRDAPIGAFPAEAYRISAHTAYDMSSHIFACHMSGIKQPTTCAGFFLRGSDHNMKVRMAISCGTISVDSISDGGLELYDSYTEMAVANGVSPDDPILEACR